MSTPVHNVPTPGDMIHLDAPELAILAALDTTLEAAVAALIVANLEIPRANPNDPHESHSPQIWTTEAFVAAARSLRSIIDRYCRTIYQNDPRTPDDSDIHF